MPSDQEQIATKLHRDHRYMLQLMQQIRALCSTTSTPDNCNGCESGRRALCHSDIENLTRTLVEITLRHNLMESACMVGQVPEEHRVAHNRAHLQIAEKMRAIRLNFRRRGNGALAIRDVSEVLELLTSHLAEYDQQLESYLLAA